MTSTFKSFETGFFLSTAEAQRREIDWVAGWMAFFVNAISQDYEGHEFSTLLANCT